MSWSELQNLFDGQGLVFWAAVTAVTLGLTMLSVSIVFQIRRALGSRPWPAVRRLFLRRKPAAPAPRIPLARPAPEGYRATGPLPAVKVAAAEPALEGALARLRSAAEHLERIHDSWAPPPYAGAASGDDSPLKGPSEDVDYVYQAGRA